jgi:UDP-glucose 4-epimerase
LTRAFVTGATGFIGSHLVRHLVTAGDHVAILLRPESDPWRIAHVINQVEVVQGRLSDGLSLARRVEGLRPDVVYHLAWFGSGAAERDDPRQLTENVAAAVWSAELAASVGAAWIGLGSQAEYGPTAAILDESTPTRPVTPYGAAKLSSGRLTAEVCARRSVRHVWLRLLTAYGPADHPSYLIPHVILTLLAHRRPALSEGTQLGDFLYVGDVCEALRTSAATPACSGTYVLASGDHRSVREIATAIRDLIDPGLQLGFGELRSSSPPTGLRGNPAAFEAATGWSPHVSLRTGLAVSIDWYRSNSNRYAVEMAL